MWRPLVRLEAFRRRVGARRLLLGIVIGVFLATPAIVFLVFGNSIDSGSVNSSASGSPRTDSFVQGKDSLGVPVPKNISDPDSVIEGSGRGNSEDRFFCSLGIGGSFVIEFPQGFADGPGADIQVREMTWGEPGGNDEDAQVFISEDRREWIYIGDADNSDVTTSSPVTVRGFELAGREGRFIRVSDVTMPQGIFSQNGFDLASVRVMHAR